MEQASRIRITEIPLDTSATAVAARITELLPGAVFDARGHGAFQRGHYTVTFDIDADGSGVEIRLNHADGFTALNRVATKTGWHVTDPVQNIAIDLDASREQGAVVLAVPQRGQLPIATEADRPAWWRWTWRAAATAGVVVFVWLGWQWSRRAPTIRSVDHVLQPVAGVSPDDAAAPSASAGDKAAARRYAQQYLADAAERVRVRMKHVKFLAPEFRGDPIVEQLLDYQEALSKFDVSTSERRVLAAERLADRSLLPVFWPNGLLPASFVDSVRNGYRFESIGTDCGHRGETLRELTDLCEAIVYLARPLDSAAGLRTYAFYTADNRIHYRRDGQTPTRDDPTVDNTTPSDASDIPGAMPERAKATPPPKSKEETGVLARLSRWIQKAVGAAGFRSIQEASVAYRESDVIKDLRMVFAAEMEFSFSEVGSYAAPEKLADAANYKAVQWQPLLPGYFVQPLRQGYRFEFIGDGERPPRFATSKPFGPVYRSFVYAARPVEPGPAGRRSLAIFPDGVVFATTENRVPTRDDTPLGDR